MDFLLDLLKEHLPTLIGTAVVALVAWGLSKVNLPAALEDAITAYTKRGLDKAQVWFNLSIAPDSDGGATITAAELSQLRNEIWLFLQEELKSKGPLYRLLMDWGEEKVKGLIGLVLEKLGVRVGAQAPPELIRVV